MGEGRKVFHVIRENGTTYDVDMTDWHFSVIYSADCCKQDDVLDWAPPATVYRCKNCGQLVKQSEVYDHMLTHPLVGARNLSRHALLNRCEVVETPWERTEDDQSYEYDHLEGDWEGGHHGKWVAELTLEEFEAFLEECYLEAEDVETMGAIGAPGYEGWCAPAVAFEANDVGAICSAYVTPLIPKQEAEPVWEDVRMAIIQRYQDGPPFSEWEE